MILVRNSFQLKFGMAKEAKASMKEGLEIVTGMGVRDNRACLDVTGPFYTLVLENTFDSLSAFVPQNSHVGDGPSTAHLRSSYLPILRNGARGQGPCTCARVFGGS